MSVAQGTQLSGTGKSEDTTLTALLLRAAKKHALSGLHFLSGKGYDGAFVSYADLLQKAQLLARGLRALAPDLDRKVVLLLENPEDVIPALWACILGGYAVCPMVPVRGDPERWSKHLKHVDALLNRPLFVSTSHLMHDLQCVSNPVSLAEFPIGEPLEEFHRASPEEIALIMLTSGSTGNSKAVALTHRNVLASMESKNDQEQLNDRDILLNWVSFDHVAALLMVHLLAISVGATQVQAEPTTILANPLIFLRLLDRFRVTMTFTPNFLLGRINSVLQGLPPNESELALNLRCVRHILTGGEANPVATGRQFLALLSPYGLAQNVLWPVYGMTETCGAVTYSREFPEIDKDSEFATVGMPAKGLEMRIVDEHGALTPDSRSGNLEVRGPFVFTGYYNNQDATNSAFTDDGWFRTGDLGRVDRGRLTLVGRSKDSIIVSGVNYFSHELETTLEQLAGIERSFVAVFPTRPKGVDTEQLVVTFATTYSINDESRIYQLIVAVRNTTIMTWGFRPAVILPLPKSAFPKTSLGKIQRSLMRKQFESGELNEHIARAAGVTNRQLGGHIAPRGAIESSVAQVFGEMFSLPGTSIGATTSFFDLGGTSVEILKLTEILRQRFDLDATLTTVLQYPTVRELAAQIMLGDREGEGSYDPLVPLQLSGRGAPLFCIHPGDGGTLVFVNLAKYFVNERPFYALRPRGFNRSEMCFQSYDELINTYLGAIVRAQPHGPYAIAGYSLGAAIAFDLAKELESRGEQVSFLGCIDGEPRGTQTKLDFSDTMKGAADVLQLMDVRQFSTWAKVAQSLQNISREQKTKGTVKSMTVFRSAGFPDKIVPSEWVGALRRWNEFVEDASFIEVEGDHMTLMAPKHVLSFQAVLRSELNASLQDV